MDQVRHKSIKKHNTRVILGLSMLFVILALAGCRKTGEEVLKERYRHMFGSIVVPNHTKSGEPTAPSPSVYLITNMHGEIIHFRRHRPDIGQWEFDEVKIGDIASKKGPSCVIVADKSLGKGEFLTTVRSFRKIASQDNIWIQVWGVHPYPLQMPLDVRDIDALEDKFSECQHLQEIVDLLAQPKSLPQRGIPWQPGASLRVHRHQTQPILQKSAGNRTRTCTPFDTGT